MEIIIINNNIGGIVQCKIYNKKIQSEVKEVKGKKGEV